MLLSGNKVNHSRIKIVSHDTDDEAPFTQSLLYV